MAKPEITTQLLSNEIENLNACVTDYICLSAEQLPEDSNLHAIGTLIMQHHDVLTFALQEFLKHVRQATPPLKAI